MLSKYLALDLTGANGMFCGYLLAHLGCEVIAVEPPGGSPARRMAPLSNNQPDSSVWWAAYARGKQSTELDLTSSEGRRAFLDLVAQADFVIESWTQSEAERLDLSYQTLAEINPQIIVVSITNFGRTGPKADWPATDLTVWAASGTLMLTGDADRAPVRTSVPQTFLHAGGDAAGAALIALQERHNSGMGQLVDVSAQQSAAQATLGANLAVPNNAGYEIEREAGGLRGLFPIRMTWPSSDGFVAITFLFGSAFDEPNRRLLQWVHDHGCCSAEDVALDWGLELSAMTGEGKSPEPYFDLCKEIEAFTSQRTQQELFEEGLKRGVYIAPTLDVVGLLDEAQFSAREFWHEIPHAPVGQVRVPGAFAKFSATPLRLPGAAPELGAMRPRTPPSAATEPTGKGSDLPLAGLKVLDFMWVIAGPFFTRVLAEYGATVIKVESSQRLEPARGAPTFIDAQPGVENGVPFLNFNTGKLGVTIDPSNEVGREVILDLVRWADVVTESFSPKAMKAWGLDYESLKEINPSLIMMSSCLMGQTGPRAQVPGYGNMAAALSGFYDLTGWQDRSPAGPYLAYTDGVAPRFMLVSLFAAMEHRRDTGEGQYIDISQAEAAIHFLAPAVLDYEVNGHVWHRMGNRDRELAPHGVYATHGDDEWIAIVCQSDEVWPALCTAMSLSDEANDLALKTGSGRLAKADALDKRIGQWTRMRSAQEIESILIAAGVAAHVVLNSAATLKDPQMQHREHFVTVSHASHSGLIVEGTRVKLSRTPGRVERGAPELGEHNFEVLTEILGYDGDRIADIYAALAME